MFLNSNSLFLGNKPITQIFFRGQTLTRQLTTSPPSDICVSDSGSVLKSTYIYSPNFGGLAGLLYYSTRFGLSYYIRFNSFSNLYELVHFISLFQQTVLYSSYSLLGTWSINGMAGSLPAPVVTEGACTT